MTFYFSLSTPEAKVFEGKVDSLFVPGSSGYMEILNHHAPLITTLHTGTITFYQKEEKHTYTISSGLLEVQNNQAILIADTIML